jgi:uncharacterized membrane protein YqjE
MEPPAREAPPSDTPPGGLLHSLRTLLATLLATARTRGELLQVEWEEERLRIAGIAVFALAAAFFLSLAVVVLTVFLLLLFWDSNRLLVAGLISLAYLIVGLICASVARQRARVKSKLFAASLAELDKDCRRLDSDQPVGERLTPS